MNQIQTLTQKVNLELDPLDDFVRVPGLLRRWEIEQVVTGGAEYRIEEAGELSDKTQVFAVYRREHAQGPGDRDPGVPVALTFEDERLTVRARLLPISGDEPVMAVLVLSDSPADAATLARVRDHLAKSGTPSAEASGGRSGAAPAAECGRP
jgi:hypothetical protein